jgi:hypothetical protein
MVFVLSDDFVAQQKPRRRSKRPGSVRTNELSRSRAADIIKRYPEFKSTFDSKVLVGHIWEDGMSGDDLDSFRYAGELDSLVDQGILTIIKTGQTQYGRYVEHLTELTPKGELEAKKWVKTEEKIHDFINGPTAPSVTVYRMVLAERQLIGVTGIAIDEGGSKRWFVRAHCHP